VHRAHLKGLKPVEHKFKIGDYIQYINSPPDIPRIYKVVDIVEEETRYLGNWAGNTSAFTLKNVYVLSYLEKLCYLRMTDEDRYEVVTIGRNCPRCGNSLTQIKSETKYSEYECSACWYYV
jgi:hypothetical protein